ncbi:sigma-70 family RNA polymerase sigma factor [Ravibacter arvi]|uniref:Sigma-70 family RNA polymerase sigma factor n=1 Tax=Ravibacter arvi TaxID=2051041 RepID=A0ABP8LNI9_9BACT
MSLRITPEDEIRLWSAYREGNKDALGTLAEHYYRTLTRYGLKFGVDRFVVEDCIQNVFLTLWQNRSRISTTGSVKFYLFKSFRHDILHYRDAQQRFSRVDESEWDWSFPDRFNAEAHLIEKESFAATISQLQTQLSALPKREREAVYLRYYENLEVHEIAEIMGVNRQSVSNFLQKALGRIRSRWMSTLAALLVFY